MGIEQIVSGHEVLGIIVRRDFSAPGVHFLTPNEFSQQLGYIQHPVGKVIQPHIHKAVERAVTFTQEVLFVRRGKIRVDFYSDRKEYVESRVLEAGDIVLLASAGHGFEVLEDVELFEVKQGPYVEVEDKTRFEGVPPQNVIVRGGGA
jgi:hypothetical protein